MSLIIGILVMSMAMIPLSYVFAGYNREARTNVYLIVMFIFLFSVHAFKDWYCLPDLPAYARNFDLFHEGLDFDQRDRHHEVGYSAMAYAIARSTQSLLFFSIIVSGIIIGGYFFLIKKWSEIPWLSVFLLICSTYTQSIFVIRQHIAVVICLFASFAIIRRKLWVFLLIVILAGLFHKSAFIFLPAFFIYSIPIGKKFPIWLIIVALIASAVLSIAIQYVSLEYMLYDNYMTATLTEEDRTNATPALISSAVLILSLIVLKYWRLQGYPKLFFLMVCTAFLLHLGGIGIPGTTRLTTYYSVYSIFLIPNIISKLKGLQKYFVLGGLITCYTLLFLNTIHRGNLFDNFHLIFM